MSNEDFARVETAFNAGQAYSVADLAILISKENRTIGNHWLVADRDVNTKKIACACGAVWPWERFKSDRLKDCPNCKPDSWSLATNLASDLRPIGISVPNA